MINKMMITAVFDVTAAAAVVVFTYFNWNQWMEKGVRLLTVNTLVCL